MPKIWSYEANDNIKDHLAWASQKVHMQENNSIYLKWNGKIAAHFFHPEMGGRSVHLYVTEELLESLGLGSLSDFMAAVNEGPPWVSSSHGICQKAYQAFENWRERENLEYPPYIAYLALFVLAAGIEGDFAAHAYYPRLRQLLGEPQGSMLPSFDRMLDIWDDLEVWSNQDKQGELGVFNIHIAGSWIHVGLPKAQTILTEHERKFLPAIFAEAKLDPLSPTSDAEFVRLIHKCGKQRLRPRTLDLLANPRDESDLREFLLQTVRDELDNWDGTVEEAGDDATTPQPQSFGNLRLCLTIDRTAGRATASIRCSLNQDFPDEALQLTSRSAAGIFTADEFLPGWSYPLRSNESGTELNAALLDWETGSQFEDRTKGLRFRLPASPIRVFLSGKPEGLPGLIEVRQLTPNHEFYLAASSNCTQKIMQWGETGCQGFREIEMSTGLPEDWRLFYAEKALTDQAIGERFPQLAFSKTIRLLLRHGIRNSQGNHFFFFAPPDVILQGGEGDEKVFCDDTELSFDSDKSVYVLPAKLPADRQIRILVKRGNEVLTRRSFWLTRELDSRWFEPSKLANKFGDEERPSDAPDSGLAGAFLKNVTSPNFQFEVYPQLFDCQRVYFVGKTPGQVVSWPLEPMPDTWAPVWAIAMMKKRGNAIFCSSNLDSARPVAEQSRDHKKMKQWKQVLWYWRKRISGPEHPSARRLWNEYQEAAGHV